MKKFLYILIPFLFISCTGDDNWFVRTVKYDGELTEPKMIVQGGVYNRYVFIDLFESQFFLSYDSLSLSNPLVDANVTMSINGDEYGEPFVFDDMRHYYPDRKSIRVNMGDHFKIRVEHPKYGVAYVEQKIPYEVPAELTMSDIDENGNIHVDAHFDAYQGDPTDVLTIQPFVDVKCTIMKNGKKGGVAYTLASIYSDDAAFSHFPYFNIPAQDGYYGSNEGLRYPLSELSTAKTVHFVIPIRRYMYPDMVDAEIVDWTIDRVSITFTSSTSDTYKQEYAERIYLGIRNQPVGLVPSENGDWQEKEGDAGRGFNTLGTMEKVQLYNNVKGDGYGCVGAYTSWAKTLIKSKQ